MSDVIRSAASPPEQQALGTAFLGKLIKGIKGAAKRAAPIIGKIARAVAPMIGRAPGRRPDKHGHRPPLRK